MRSRDSFRAMAFAARCLLACRGLLRGRRAKHEVSPRGLRGGTSVGANLGETQGGGLALAGGGRDETWAPSRKSPGRHPPWRLGDSPTAACAARDRDRRGGHRVFAVAAKAPACASGKAKHRRGAGVAKVTKELARAPGKARFGLPNAAPLRFSHVPSQRSVPKP